MFASASTDASVTRSLLVTVSDSVPMRAVSKSSVSQLKNDISSPGTTISITLFEP